MNRNRQSGGLSAEASAKGGQGGAAPLDAEGVIASEARQSFATLNTTYEQHFQTLGHTMVAGVDEVGRGPLAGPVTAAAVIVPAKESLRAYLLKHAGDSKTIAAPKRAELSQLIRSECIWSLGWATVEEIDAVNIRQATFLAMTRALQGLATPAHAAVIDGLDVPPQFSIPATSVIKGDAVELAISCASLVAKVARDEHMAQLAQAHPHYSWHSNAGYGSAAHLKALRQFGVTPHHRRSFAPVKAVLEAVMQSHAAA
jgi:ribonuclease HII